MSEPEKRQLKLGFIPLTDCAPLVVALEKGYFREHGLDVTLCREGSWATIRDKVAYGLLDGAHMLAGLPIAASLGLGSPATPMVTALGLNLNGNAITVSNPLYERMLRADSAAMASPGAMARALKAVIDADQGAGARRMTFAMVYPVSSHHYILRHWLASGTIDPERDVRLIVIPPPQMVNYLGAGAIDGYCVGEPWNALAVREGLGHAVISSYEVWNNHPEKVLGVTEAWAQRHPQTHQALLRALLQASRWLENPENRPEAIELLANHRYVDVPAEAIAMGMSGMFRSARDQARVALPDFNVFYRYAATFPWRSHAVLLLARMYRWGQLGEPVVLREVAERVYRPDLYRQAAQTLGIPYPTIDYKAEDIHAEPWTLREASEPIAMGPDLAVEGLRYIPSDLPGYLRRLGTGHGAWPEPAALRGRIS